MKNFNYYAPTRVVFGIGAETQTGALIRAQGGTRVLVHYGTHFAQESGLLDRVCASLREAELPYVLLGGVVPNPRVSLIREGIELCRRENVDFLLAVGGGSVIDSAKAIGYGLCYDGDVWDIYAKKAVPTACAPVGAVVTFSAAGSEMSDSSVITNEDGWLKRGCNNDLCRCRFAVLNPELTVSLSPWQTACGCTDILMHTMERYFTTEPDTELTDAIAESLRRTVIRNARAVMKDPGDLNARSQIMWAGSLSHNGLTGCGTVGDWACHQLEHEISGMFDVDHGAGLAAIWASWARYVYQEKPERFAQFATRVMGLNPKGQTAEWTALAGIRAFEAFLTEIGMPISIGGLGVAVTDKNIEEMAWKCSFENTRTIGNFRRLELEDIRRIYLAAR